VPDILVLVIQRSALAIGEAAYIENKITAREVADTCDWSEFISRYVEAHNVALKNLN